MDGTTKQALAYLSNFIFKNYPDARWTMAGNSSGIDIEWEDHQRLFNAQSWNDPDYQDTIYRFLSYVYEKDSNALRHVFRYIFDGSIPEDPNAKVALSNLDIITSFEGKYSLLSGNDLFLEIDDFPDDFYKELIHLINNAYEHRMYPVMPLLIRKLFENLLIDILRTFYGTQEIEIFYNVNKNRFNDFSTLIENCRINLNDLKIYKDVFNESLLDKINKHRSRGNSSAHTLSVDMSKKEIDSSKDEADFIIKSLFRTIKLLTKRI